MARPVDQDTRASGSDAPMADSEALPAGFVTGDYRLEGRISAGAFGTVYKAKHQHLGRTVAVKVLSRAMLAAPTMMERFVREARTASQLRHPNIVDIFGFGQLDDGRPYYVMEYLEGETLTKYVERFGRLTPAEALNILDPICSALQAAHDAGVVHRDLKGANIVIGEANGKLRVTLVDFGIAKLLHPEPGEAGLTTANTRLGTPTTMSPEQVKGGAVDHRADIYALGVMLYLMLTGEAPFRGSVEQIEMSHLHEPPPSLGRVIRASAALDAVVTRAMQKAPESRFQTVGALLAALRASVSGEAEARIHDSVGFYVETRMSESAMEDPSDALLDRMAQVLDLAATLLSEAGFHVALQTGTAVLGVFLLPAEPAQATRKAGQLIPTGSKLAQRLLSAAGDPDLIVCATLHRATVFVQTGVAGPQISDGAILSLSDWAPSDLPSGFRLTAEAAKCATAPVKEEQGGRFFTLPE